MKSAPRFHYGWVIAGVGLLVIFSALGLARFSYTMVLPAMQTGLGMNNTEAGVLATANLIGYLGFALIGGALASRYGPRALIAFGLTLAGISMLLTGLADSTLVAAAWRVLTGIGSGASNVPMMALLPAWFAARRRGLASGIVVAGSAFALILTGLLVPFLLSVYGPNGWRVSWFVFGGLVLVVATVSFIFLRNWPSEKGLRQVGANHEDMAPGGKGDRMDWGRVYRSPKVWHLGLVYAAFGFSYIIFMTFFSKHLIAQGGYSQAEAGRLFMIMGWFSIPCGLLWGTASDVIGRKQAMIIVYLIHATAFSLFALWPSTPGFTLAAILFGISAWSIPAIVAASCGDVLGPKMAPAALGFTTFFFGIAQALGPVVAGAMADRAGSFAPAFILAAGVAIVGALSASLLRQSEPYCEVAPLA